MTNKTLMDHCREWYAKQGINIDPIPVHSLKTRFYECWVNYAFAGIVNEYGIDAGKVYRAEGGI
ncbi:hypothetical protein M0R72_15255 [Candidatus Pacearchaeota archaeon]|nr:hypothetical protein [Candidatus Pacearchaeota archaeon]